MDRDCNVAVDEVGRTALILASWRGDWRQVQKLLRSGADVTYKARGGVTCLHAAAFAGHKLVVRFLLGWNKSGENRSKFQTLLESSTDTEEFTALHVSASAGHETIVQELVEAILSLGISGRQVSALLNARDCLKRTPLHHAAWMERGRVEEVLLAYEGVEVNAEDIDGYTPLHLALIKGRRGAYASKVVSTEALTPLLDDANIDLTAEARSNATTRGLLLSKSQDRSWEKFPMPSLADYMVEEFHHNFTPMRLVVHLQDAYRGGEVLLETIWNLRRPTLEREIIVEIEKQLRSIVEQENNGSYNLEGTSLMHMAAFVGSHGLMQILVTREKYLDELNKENLDGQTPLHWASLRGHIVVVKFLCDQPTLRGVVEDNAQRTALEIAHAGNHKAIKQALLKRSDVRDYMDMLHSDRQHVVDATNALLVGGTLVAGITFVGWLQPPLGYQSNYDFLVSNPAAPPQSYEQFAQVNDYMTIRAFYLLNSVSFYFSIAAILAGAAAVVPRTGFFIKAEVKRLNQALKMTSFTFSWAVICCVGAFSSAGFASIPPVFQYQIILIVPLVLGVYICFRAFNSSRREDPPSAFPFFLDPGFYFSKSFSDVRLLGSSCQTIWRNLGDGWNSVKIKIMGRLLEKGSP